MHPPGLAALAQVCRWLGGVVVQLHGRLVGRSGMRGKGSAPDPWAWVPGCGVTGARADAPAWREDGPRSGLEHIATQSMGTKTGGTCGKPLTPQLWALAHSGDRRRLAAGPKAEVLTWVVAHRDELLEEWHRWHP